MTNHIGPSLKLILEREGYAVSSIALCRNLEHADPAVAWMLPPRCEITGWNGIDILNQYATRQPCNGIMISGQGSIADAVEATRNGAFDFLEKRSPEIVYCSC